MWETGLSHEQLARFEALEERVQALEDALGSGGDVEPKTWETPQEEEEGTSSTRRRSKRSSEGGDY